MSRVRRLNQKLEEKDRLELQIRPLQSEFFARAKEMANLLAEGIADESLQMHIEKLAGEISKLGDQIKDVEKSIHELTIPKKLFYSVPQILSEEIWVKFNINADTDFQFCELDAPCLVVALPMEIDYTDSTEQLLDSSLQTETILFHNWLLTDGSSYKVGYSKQLNKVYIDKG